MASSKKGISSNQLHRALGITLKSAWFMSHRIREAMRTGGLGPMGGAGSVVEADETYFGKTDTQPTMRADGLPYKHKGKSKSGPAGQRAVVALVERGGNVRSFHVDKATKLNVAAIVAANETVLNTDESRLYTEVGALFAAHDTVNHSGNENVRGLAPIPTPRKAFSASSSAARRASTSTVARSTCTAIWLNTTSAITTALRSVATM
jgi:hypothetical protein